MSVCMQVCKPVLHQLCKNLNLPLEACILEYYLLLIGTLLKQKHWFLHTPSSNRGFYVWKGGSFFVCFSRFLLYTQASFKPVILLPRMLGFQVMTTLLICYCGGCYYFCHVDLSETIQGRAHTPQTLGKPSSWKKVMKFVW